MEFPSLPEQKRLCGWIFDPSTSPSFRFGSRVHYNSPQSSFVQTISYETFCYTGTNSFRSFYEQRPRPAVTHEPTPFETRRFIPKGPNSKPVVLDVVWSPMDGYTEFIGVGFTPEAMDTRGVLANLTTPLPEHIDPSLMYTTYKHELNGDVVTEERVYEGWESLDYREQWLQNVVGDYDIEHIDPISFDSEKVSRADAAARSRVYSNMARGDINIGVALAELPDTLEFLATNVFRLSKFVSKLLRADIFGALKALRYKPSRRVRGVAKKYAKGNNTADIADYILEHNFGLQPLLADIWGALDLITKGLRSEGSIVHVRGSYFSNEDIRNHVGSLSRNERMVIRPSFYDGTENSVAVHYNVAFKVVDPTLRNLQEMGLLNPLEIVWEKVPFSFLVDWILNLNEIMASITAGAGIEFLHGSRTTYILGPAGLTEETQSALKERFVSFLENAGYFGVGEPEITLDDTLGGLLLTKREVLSDFPLEIDPAALRVKANPLSSDSRISSFLALMSKVLR